ncbi:disintegrin and metalloproteinase domain-containing protein 28 [Trichonephila clavipes]|nr:disintegrin and metalloproteinase domain-containing protein 28 [Trichonephila clavipes]
MVSPSIDPGHHDSPAVCPRHYAATCVSTHETAPRSHFSTRQGSASHARVSQGCLRTVNTLPWPSRFPDLSPIEHIWDHFGRDSYCGSLQCSEGEKEPVSKDVLPMDFVVYKMNTGGSVHECKTRTFSSTDLKYGLVKDGTKCGYQKLCLNQTCTSIRSIISGKCPLEEIHSTCSGHGVCTNINTCNCEEGWKGHDCSIIDEDNQLGNAKNDADYYDSMGESLLESSQYVFSSIVRDFLELFYNLWRTVLAKNKIVLDPALRLQSFRTPENATIGVRSGIECQQQERWRPSSRLF